MLSGFFNGAVCFFSGGGRGAGVGVRLGFWSAAGFGLVCAAVGFLLADTWAAAGLVGSAVAADSAVAGDSSTSAGVAVTSASAFALALGAATGATAGAPSLAGSAEGVVSATVGGRVTNQAATPTAARANAPP